MIHPKSVQFHPDGTVVMEYIEVPGDFRENGMAQSRYLMVPPDLIPVVDELEELRDAAQRALIACSREFSSSRAISAEEALGMEEAPSDVGYDNPLERDEVLE